MSSAGWRHHRAMLGVTVTIVCAGLLAGCDSGNPPSAAPSEPLVTAEPSPPPSASSLPSASSSPPVTASASTSQSVGKPSATPAKGNALFPLKPGFQSVRQGFVTKGSRRLPHRLVFTVTDVAKQVDGVRTVVGFDQDFDGGVLAEQSLELMALDQDGSVRYLGSYTETYEGGQFVNSTDAWLSGVKGARSGVLVPGVPRVGMPSFTQAVVPGEGAATAKVVKTGERKCVPFRCFTDVVVVEEDGSELKYYAPGVGGILTVPLSGNPQETEELINVTALSGQGLAEISAEALKLDQHARTVSQDVYGRSAPARRAA